MFCIACNWYKDEEKVAAKPLVAGSKSKLPKAVQELVALIFDVDTMKKSLVEFEVGHDHLWIFIAQPHMM